MSPEATSPHPSHEDLYAYRDGELAAERRRMIEAHVLGCRACRESIDELSELEAQLRAAPDAVEEGYYDSLAARTMERVRAADTAPRVERRRAAAEIAAAETRARPRFPWPALTAAVGAAATVVVVVGLLIRQESVWRSAPDVAVLERSAPDAARLGTRADTTVPPPPPTETGAASRRETDADAGAKSDAAATGRADKTLAKTETSEGKLASERMLALPDDAARESRAREVEGTQEKRSEDLVAQQRAPVAAAPQAEVGSVARDQAANAEPGLAATLRRFALPPVWGPGVSDDLVLRAEPALRNLYRTGGAATALDSARVRLYLAEAARIRLGSARPDSASIEAITHHYRRAVQLGASDAATRNTASARLQDFERELSEP